MRATSHTPLRALPVLQPQHAGDARESAFASAPATGRMHSGGGGGPRQVDHLRASAPPSERYNLDPARISKIAALLPALAPLVEYPTPALAGEILGCRRALAEECPEAAERLSELFEWVINEPVEAVEEAYTRTFYLSPVCVPYVSVHIFGDESFQRGALMARLRDAFQECGFDAGPELPDHLAILLRFSARLDGEELLELVEYCLAAPVQKMDDQIGRTSNPYRHALRAIRLVLAPPNATGAA